MSSRLLFWVPLVSLLMMIIWGFIGWFGIGIQQAGVLGDSMAPITAMLNAFVLVAALVSLELQRKSTSSRFDEIDKNKEETRWSSFLTKLERLDAVHHVSSAPCPFCEMLDRANHEK